MARYAGGRNPAGARAATTCLAGTLVLITWGAFAFGGVYPWAYVPLAIGSACVGAFGVSAGLRSIDDLRVVLVPLAGFGILVLAQTIPLPTAWLAKINPGTVSFLQRYDLSFSLPSDALPGSHGLTSHAISIAPELTIRGALLFAAFALLLVGLCRTLSRTTARQLAGAIVFVGCVMAVVGIGQNAVLGEDVFGGMRIYGFWRPSSLLTTPFGPFINKNHFAGWMLMAMPLAIGLTSASIESARRQPGRNLPQILVWLSGPDGGKVWLYSLSTLVMCASLLMTGSRSGLLCMLVIVGGALFALRRSLSTAALSGTGVVSLMVLVGLLQWAGRDAALGRFVQDTDSLQMRLSIWKASLDVIRRTPLFGTGLDTFGTVMIVSDPDPTKVHYAEAHNDYLQLLVETGVLGLALVLVAAGSTVHIIRRRLRDDDGIEMRWTRRGAAIGLLAIAVQSVAEFSLQMPGNATLFVALLALALFKPAALRNGSASPQHLPHLS